MSIVVEPGTESCFYESVKEGDVIYLNYQVTSGGQGRLDINFRLVSPFGFLLLSDFKKAHNAYKQVSTESGVFTMCWDNTFSHYNSKAVFFELLLDEQYGHGIQDREQDDYDNLISEENKYQMKILDIQLLLNKVYNNLEKVQHLQDTWRALEARDRNVIESNFTRVNWWSLLQSMLMIVVCLIQVVMIRSIFDETSRAHQLWKKRNLK